MAFLRHTSHYRSLFDIICWIVLKDLNAYAPLLLLRLKSISFGEQFDGFMDPAVGYSSATCFLQQCHDGIVDLSPTANLLIVVCITFDLYRPFKRIWSRYMIRRPHVVRTSSGVHVQLFVKRQPRGPATTTPGTNVAILSGDRRE